LRLAHFGDFGQRSLRDEQVAALGRLDMVFLPVGAGPTIGPEQAAAIVERLAPRWVVPMHYRTHHISFLDPPDAFLERMPHVHRCDEPRFDTDSLPTDGMPLVVVPAVP
ncbi:MAG: MBL fold metallo-hydrolase, partial [Solirubrobacterales bacterium]|nr:MBL fold metallo-hydrolase [Solirubrobacterales bacterium]